MARKAVAQGTDKQVAEAVEAFKAMTEMRYEMAMDVYKAQDDETQAVLERIRDVLRLAATGYIEVMINPPHSGVLPVKIEQQYVDYNLMYVATEILKTLAVFDVQIANFEFPPSNCVTCGAELDRTALTKRKKRKGAKRG